MIGFITLSFLCATMFISDCLQEENIIKTLLLYLIYLTVIQTLLICRVSSMQCLYTRGGGGVQYYGTTGLVKFTNSGFCVCLNQGNRFHSGWHNELLTRLEVREGSDFPRFRERIRTRLDVSDDAWPAVCWRLVGSRRYLPAKQNRRENTEHKHSENLHQLYLRTTENKWIVW